MSSTLSTTGTVSTDMMTGSPTASRLFFWIKRDSSTFIFTLWLPAHNCGISDRTCVRATRQATQLLEYALFNLSWTSLQWLCTDDWQNHQFRVRTARQCHKITVSYVFAAPAWRLKELSDARIFPQPLSTYLQACSSSSRPQLICPSLQSLAQQRH